MPEYRNDSCCCNHEPRDPYFDHSAGDVESPADIIQPDILRVCAGGGDYEDGDDPVPAESWDL